MDRSSRRSSRPSDTPHLADQIRKMEQQLKTKDSETKDLTQKLSQALAQSAEKDKVIDGLRRKRTEQDFYIEENVAAIKMYRHKLDLMRASASENRAGPSHLTPHQPIPTESQIGPIRSTPHQPSQRSHPYSSSKSPQDPGPSTEQQLTIEQAIQDASRKYSSLCRDYQAKVNAIDSNDADAVQSALQFSKSELAHLQRTSQKFQDLCEKLDSDPAQSLPSLEPRRARDRCFYCSEEHFENNCRAYPNRSTRILRLRELEVKEKLIACRQCLGVSHNEKNCKSKRNCQICRNSNHHTSLCPTQP